MHHPQRPLDELQQDIQTNESINLLNIHQFISDETRIRLLQLCFPKQESERGADWGESINDRLPEYGRDDYDKQVYRVPRSRPVKAPY